MGRPVKNNDMSYSTNKVDFPSMSDLIRENTELKSENAALRKEIVQLKESSETLMEMARETMSLDARREELDAFAIPAMQAIIASGEANGQTSQFVAELAYHDAEAMIKEREKRIKDQQP